MRSKQPDNTKCIVLSRKCLCRLEPPNQFGRSYWERILLVRRALYRNFSASEACATELVGLTSNASQPEFGVGWHQFLVSRQTYLLP